MTKINSITLKDRQVDILYQNGKLAYSFDYNGKAYGQGIKLKNRGVADIAAVCFLLFTNAIETMAELEKDEN